MNKHICVSEAYEWIYIGDQSDQLTLNEYDSLMKYLKNNIEINEKFIEIKHKKFRFINYVGILNVGNLIIEVLPKISLSNDKNHDKKILLQMLSKCTDLELNLDEAISSKIQNYNLLELLASKYINSLLKEMNRGIYFEYRNQEENLNVMKGKLLFKEHVKNNYANKVKAFCGYSEYSSDNILNQILKLACVRILNKVYNIKVTNKTKKALFDLGNVSIINVSKEMLDRVKLSRHNKRFSKCLELARFILLNISNENSLGSSNGFSMLFEMNTLYEQYIGKAIKVLWSGEGRTVSLHDQSKYLSVDTETNIKKFNLKPDIVLNDNNAHKLVIDTKWKAIEYESKLSYNINDIYQMYAYITNYKEATRVILLYPFLTECKKYPSWELLNYKGKFIDVKTVRLDEYKNTVEDLKNIILVV
jgi:5-methylcytosine-specific restriction enzyme subunit McrC